MNWLTKIASEIPPVLWGLAAEARKYDSPTEFEKAFIGQIKHGMYWHVTDDPNFHIDPQKGPRDMSSMSISSSPTTGKLMVTSHLVYWASNYFPNRLYAALIYMSEVPPQDYYQVNRGMGNEFFVTDPSKAKVVKVFHLKDALRIDDMHHEALPKNSKELTAFYFKAQKEKNLPPHESIFNPSEEDKDYYEQLWKDEWLSTLEDDE